MTAARGVALVSVTLRNDTGADLRVRVENDLDGPVLPPRREGLPAAGWDDDGYTGTVPAGGRLGVGYACPAPETVSVDDADPVSVELRGPADDADAVASVVAGVVRSLGRAVPPADAVPADSAVGVDGPRARTERSDRTADANVPRSVATWLDAVDRRVRCAERLVDANAATAAATLDDCGGVDGVVGLLDDLDADAAALRAVRERVDDLAGRAAAANPEPVVSALAAAAEGSTEPAAASRPPEANAEAAGGSGGRE